MSAPEQPEPVTLNRKAAIVALAAVHEYERDEAKALARLETRGGFSGATTAAIWRRRDKLADLKLAADELAEALWPGRRARLAASLAAAVAEREEETT